MDVVFWSLHKMFFNPCSSQVGHLAGLHEGLTVALGDVEQALHRSRGDRAALAASYATAVNQVRSADVLFGSPRNKRLRWVKSC